MTRNWRGRGGRGRPWFPRKRLKTNNQNDNSSNAGSSNASIRPSGSIQSTARAPAKQQIITNSINDCENKVWTLYFPQEDYSNSKDILNNVSHIKEYVKKYRNHFDLDKIDTTRCVPLDLPTVLSDEELKVKWPNFSIDLNDKPEITLRTLELALHESLGCESRIRVRIRNHQPVTPLTNLKVNYYGKMVTVKGTIMRVGTPSLICTSMAFKCGSCKNVIAITQPQGVFTAPTSCSKCMSYSGMQPLHSSPYTVTNDWQTAKLQEIQSLSVCGSIPRSVEVELYGDLAGCVSPGDVVTVTGILQVRSESRGGESEGGKSARLLQLYIEAVSVHAQKNLTATAVSFTLSDYYCIREIHSSPDIFRLLVHSLCPSIFGHEAVKAGLILSLFGGGKEDERAVHVLLVGDPGLGKSRLLQATVQVAPRGVYVCGASTSAGGVTACAVRGSVEAGALVLAHSGLCAVDELDNMPAHAHAALLEAMERGRVSVAKAGAVCSLAARASLIAAANPQRGHYDRSKTVVENLKINTALLSRFDLVFILMDKPDKKIDGMLSEHVLALHAGKQKEKRVNNSGDSSQITDEDLVKRLRLRHGEVIDSLPPVLLRKYIAYARRYVHPKLTPEAANILQEFYLELRSQASDEGTPVTTRQLEACVRLTLARARASLREEASASDARDVTALVRASLADTLLDEYGKLELSRAPHGTGVSQRSKVKRFLEFLSVRVNQTGKDVFTKEELRHLHTTAQIGGNPNDMIEALHTHSYLLQKGGNVYQLLSA